MEFRNYTEIRRYFQIKKDLLTNNQLEELKEVAIKMSHKVHTMFDRKPFGELIIDIEHYIDMLNKTEVFLSEVKRNYRSSVDFKRKVFKNFKLIKKNLSKEEIMDLFNESGKEKKIFEKEFDLKVNTLKENNGLKEKIEKELIKQVLQLTDFNKAKSARIIGMSDCNLYKKMTKYDIKKEDCFD